MAYLLIIVIDVDTQSIDDIVDGIVIPIHPRSLRRFSSTDVYTGLGEYGYLTARYRVDCVHNYFGEGEQNSPKAWNEDKGHFLMETSSLYIYSYRGSKIVGKHVANWNFVDVSTFAKSIFAHIKTSQYCPKMHTYAHSVAVYIYMYTAEFGGQAHVNFYWGREELCSWCILFAKNVECYSTILILYYS